MQKTALLVGMALFLASCSLMPDVFYPLPKLVRGLSSETKGESVSQTIIDRYKGKPVSYFETDLRSQGFDIFRDSGRSTEIAQKWGGKSVPLSIVASFDRPAGFLGAQILRIFCVYKADICTEISSNVIWVGP